MKKSEVQRGRVQYCRVEKNGELLFVIYERHVNDDQTLVEELWEQGVCEVRWVKRHRLDRPDADAARYDLELIAARQLFFAGIGRSGWNIKLDEMSSWGSIGGQTDADCRGYSDNPGEAPTSSRDQPAVAAA
jgi:hypothetical protein